MEPAADPVLDRTLERFVQGPVSMNVASRDGHNQPAVARAFGCRIPPDRRQIVVFLHVPRSTALLAALRESGVMALVFSRPSTHETYQFKGRFLGTGQLTDDDRAVAARYRTALAEELGSIGFPPKFTGAMVPEAADDLVAVQFEPAEVFDQTPGPQAGRRRTT